MLWGAVGWHVYGGPAEVLACGGSLFPFLPCPHLCYHTMLERHIYRNLMLTCHTFSVSCQPAEQTFSVICSSGLFICDSCCCFRIQANILIASAFGFIILRQQEGDIRCKLVTPGCWNEKQLRSLVWKTRNSTRGPYMGQAFEIGLKQGVVCHFLSYLALTYICSSWKERI